MNALEKAAVGFGSLAILGLVWNYVKMALGWISGIFLVTQKSADDDFNRVMTGYLVHACSRRYSLGDRVHSEYRSWVKPLRRIARVFIYSFTQSKTLYLWRSPGGGGARLIAVAMGSETAAGFKCTGYTYIRGTVDWLELTRLAIDYDYEVSQMVGVHGNRYRVVHHTGTRGQLAGLTLMRGAGGSEPAGNTITDNAKAATWAVDRSRIPLHWEQEDLGPEQSPHALEQLSLTSDLHALAEEVKFWYREQDWYEARGVPWRRGYLFEGRPGTGKTSFVRALAEELDLPVHIPDLSTMDNGELGEAWAKMQSDAPCAILIEDVDAVFHGRDNIANQVLTFDCLLNCVDGVERANGVLVFVTTNHLELVDPALGGPSKDRVVNPNSMPERPGRVDRVVHFAELDDAGREKMALRILKDCLEEVPAQISLGRADTAAQFQERCFRIALRHKFNPYKPEGCDRRPPLSQRS